MPPFISISFQRKCLVDVFFALNFIQIWIWTVKHFISWICSPVDKMSEHLLKTISVLGLIKWEPNHSFHSCAFSTWVLVDFFQFLTSAHNPNIYNSADHVQPSENPADFVSLTLQNSQLLWILLFNLSGIWIPRGTLICRKQFCDF